MIGWKYGVNQKYIDKKIVLDNHLESNFQGSIFISILEDESLEMSWVSKDKNTGLRNCGGYIFKRLKYVAEENLRKIQEKGWSMSPDFWCSSVAHLDYRTQTYLDRRDRSK